MNKHLAQGYAFDLMELFENFPLEKLDYSFKEYNEKFHDRCRKKLLGKVFKECMKMVMEDIVENNDTFILPTGGKRAEIHMKKIQNEDFIKARKAGKFKDIDFFKSFYTGYQPHLYIHRTNKIYEQPIYLGGKLKQKLIDYTNNGKQYG